MKDDNKSQKKQARRKKVQLYKPKKKKSLEEDAAIQYLRAQYDKVFCIFTYYGTYIYIILITNVVKIAFTDKLSRSFMYLHLLLRDSHVFTGLFAINIYFNFRLFLKK